MPTEFKRPVCADCGASAPQTNTKYTLISASFGWRLTRAFRRNGVQVREWRCGACWRKHKASTSTVPPEPTAFSSPSNRPSKPPRGSS